MPAAEHENSNEILFRLGNESNPVDGFWGPITYGVRGNYQFQNQVNVEAGYIRLHEPHTKSSESVLDEAEFAIRSPEIHSWIFGAIRWKNRMIDMYTDLSGIEISYKADISVLGGVCAGRALLEETEQDFKEA